MDAVFHVLAYLKARDNSRMVFDPTYSTIEKTNFQEHEWKPLYGDFKEAIPNNYPETLGREVHLHMFVDSDHAMDDNMRQFRRGYFIYMNSALVNWLSKKKAMI